ncbi:DUF6907 domain-containing protein [Nocardioides sp. R1-1]|uniref:DUF6907 domain-containing protein n=1 Tax=Nocardioides sp. R1-1 TaxID=3383502 RepID=UPI0038D179E9
MVDTGVPSWLDEKCPRWCARTHCEDDHPEDRYHQSEATIFTARAGAGDDVPLNATIRPLELCIRTGRYVGERETWIVIEALEAARPRLLVTEQSARDLLHHLDRHLSRPPRAGRETGRDRRGEDR